MHIDGCYSMRVSPSPTSPVAMEFRKKIRAYDSATTTRAPAAPKAIGACCEHGTDSDDAHTMNNDIIQKYRQSFWGQRRRKRGYSSQRESVYQRCGVLSQQALPARCTRYYAPTIVAA